MHRQIVDLLVGVLLLVVVAITLATGMPVYAQGPDSEEGADEAPPVDHSLFPNLAGPFESGEQVTEQCLLCHPNAASEIHDTIHWTWEWENPETGQLVGKNNVINNFCVSVTTNEPRCTSCHVGYGWRDDSFDFTSETAVDCLVCHDTTGTYEKFPTAAGYPVSEPTDFGGKTWQPPDLGYVAQNVGPTSRETCGSCHFYGGGDAAVKHGDLDPTLLNPSHGLDVHMDSEGLDFTCTDCHTTENHQIDGSRYDVPVHADDIDGLATCEACHSEPPHSGPFAAVLNMHMDRLACQTCHIPTYAREMPTKMTWDWSEAGQLNDAGQPFTLADDSGAVIYDSKKGSFTWEQDVVPEYVWFNGTVAYTLPDMTIDEAGVVAINTLQGSLEDPTARLWPVKVFRGAQPYDAQNKMLGAVHLFPSGADDTTAYWKNWNWDAAFETAMQSIGLSYSGQYGFVETVMYWPLAHMVAPADQALQCQSCHVEGGRIDWEALGYDHARITNGLTFFNSPVD